MDGKDANILGEFEVKTFDDIPESVVVDVDSVSCEDLVGEVIVLMGYSEKDSEFGDKYYMTIEAVYNNEMISFNTGSESVTKQVSAYKPYFPLKVRMGKRGRKYYLEKS